MNEQNSAPERLTTNIVPPSGPLDAKILMIGQSPGEEEDNGLEPFIGSAGQFMFRCAKQIGLLRNEVLLNNVFVQRPPGNDAGYFFEDKRKTILTWEGREHVENLRNWLIELDPRPNLIVALGYESMFVLTGKKRVWKWRGSVLPCTLVDGYKVYVTLHPSGVLRLISEPEEKLIGVKKELANNALPLFLRDLERIRVQGEFAEIRRPKRNLDIDVAFGGLVARLEKLNRESIDCSVDIETLYGPEGPILWCIGFAPNPEYGFVVPFLRQQRFAWTAAEEAQLLRLISAYFLNPKAKKIFQNGGYDLSILGKYYGLRVDAKTYEDTMWLHHASFPAMRKSLETLTSMYTWEAYYKDEGKVNYGKRGGDKAEFEYNLKDCACTKEIHPQLRDIAAQMGTWQGYKRSMSFMPSLLAMQIRGVRMDVGRKAELEKEYFDRANIAHQTVCRMEGEYINLNSSKQLIALLYYKHNFKPQRNFKKKDQPLTADKDAMQKLKRLYPGEEVIQQIMEYKKFSKLHSTYASMEMNTDGRVRTSYGFVSTYRLSSSESHFGAGGNLQNIPVRSDEGRAIRTMFITDDMEPYPPEEWEKVVALVTKVAGPKVASTLVNGKMLMLASDLSQAEARVVAWESEDLRMINRFLDPTCNIHWENAKEIFQFPDELPYGKFKEMAKFYLTGDEFTHFEFRQMGKEIEYGVSYGMGPKQFQMSLARQGFVLPYAVCNQLLDGRLSSKPLLREWHRGIQEQLRATRTLTSSFGRRRVFQGRFNNNLWKAAYAFSPQNTVGEIVEQGIETIFENYEPKIQILLNVHDEVVTQIAPHLIAWSVPRIKAAMEIPLTIKGRELIIPAEFKAGANWGELHEFEPNLT
jgi:DNA polymerase I